MQSDQAPCSTTRRVEFPPSVTSCLRDQREEAAALLGGILSDSKLTWLSKGPLLEVVSAVDGAKIAAWTFGAVVRDFKTKVTCLAECPHSSSIGRPDQVDQLLVGLECELTGGMLCLFNLAGSRVLRAINIPSKVTAISTVSFGGGALGPLHQCFKNMNGVAAVGTNDGQILLIDLRRHDCDNALRTGHFTHWESVRDELQSCGLVPLKAANSNLSEEYSDDHMYLHLNEKYFIQHQRLLVQFPTRDGGAFMPEDPSVTSVLYIPQLASLCVGFSFGSFQIWSLQTLALVYTLPYNEPNPLVRLSFQEACDDPNAYCYLWAVRGGLDKNNSADDLDHPLTVYGPPSATMYSLCYDEKLYLPEYGHFYNNFMMCSTGFEYDLNISKDTVGGRLVSLYSVNRGMPGLVTPVQSPSDDSSALGPSSNAISLCLIVWETWGLTGPSSSVTPVNTHMAIFDINQWYVDQMPGRLSLRGGPSRNNAVASYMVSYDLGHAITASGGSLLDVRINANSVLQFSSVQNAEEFSRPSSLSFDSEVLMESQVVHLKHPGVQRALLSNLVSSGPGALMTPTNLFHECLVLGLRPLLMDISRAMDVPIEEQRTFVLFVALEQRLGRFVCRCAREWADGRLSAAGCTLSWLLSVAWNRAAVLKQLAIRICAQLFDHSGEKLDNNSQRQLHHIVGIFHLLETLFENVIQNKWHLALNEWPQVNLQNDALKLECQYYDVLQWLIDVELLPEGLTPIIPYPAQEIVGFYQRRRLELETLLQQQGKDEEMQNLLMIDSLLSNQPGGVNVFSEWERDAGGNVGHGGGKYPPASLQALLRTFLVKDVALEVKHSVVIYVLMDLANILDNDQYKSALQNFMQFPAAFRMSVGSMRLIQAFWHLDHKAFDTALDMLLDPLISVQDIDPWQHRFIIRLFTMQGQASMALRYVRARRPPLQDQCDMRLHLSLLIANDLINESFMYQRRHRTEENAGVLLSQFFEGCEERNQLRTILQFSLDDEEELAFSHYLETSKHPAADDLRVLYLLKRSRYVEALDVNQDLRKKGRSGGTRDVVVSSFYKTLPSVTRKLAAHCAQQQFKLTSWNMVEKPTPLFVNPKIASPQMRYKSSLLEAAVERSRETWAKLVGRIPPLTSNIESTPFLCTPRTKLLKHARPAITPIQNCEQSTAERKRAREDDDGDKFDLSQHKRIRFHKLESALAELQQDRPKSHQSRSSTYSCTDTLPLLNTPVVQRRSPSTRAKLQQQMIACSPGHSAVTPQSIIKVRAQASSSTTKSESPSRQRVLFKQSITEPELTEEESESEVFSSSSQPKKGESETDSEPGENGDEEGPVGVTARRIIDFESDLSSSELSLSQSSSESPSWSVSLSPMKTTTGSVLPERSLSRMVVLSEARKVGKPAHSVTFGKGSVCVYDQDEPVDSEVAVQDESSNDTVDNEPSKAEDSEDDLGDKAETNNEYSETSVCDTPSPPDEQSNAFMDSRPSPSEIKTASLTIDSPTFRKSLARPSVKEIAKHLGETQTFGFDRDSQLNESISAQSKLTAHLEEGSVMDPIELEEDEGKEDAENTELTTCSESTVATSFSESTVTISSTGSTGTTTSSGLTLARSSSSNLARPPIRNTVVCTSLGGSLDIMGTGTEVNDNLKESSNTEILETSLTQFVSPDETAKISTSEMSNPSTSVSEVKDMEVKPVLIEDSEDRVVTHDTIEIVDLDDEDESDIKSQHDVEDVDVSDEVESSDYMQEDSEGDSKIGEGTAALDDEDSEDRIGFLTDNSNIFRTTLTDDVSDSEGDSSLSKHEIEDACASGASQTQSFNEDAHLSQASIDIHPRIDGESTRQISEENVDDVSQGYIEDMNGIQPDVSHGSAVLEQSCNKQTTPPRCSLESSDIFACKEINVSCALEGEHDDMPQLKLESVDLESHLFSPSKLQNSVASMESGNEGVGSGENLKKTGISVPQKELMPSETVNVLEPQQELKPPSPKDIPTSALDVPSGSSVVEHVQPVTPKSSNRRGTRRRTSVSSSLSEAIGEEEVPVRRVTRASASSAEVLEVSSEQMQSVCKQNSSRGSLSSQDVQKNTTKQSRSRRSSVSSVGSQMEEKEVQPVKSRKRRSSISSQGSMVDNDPSRFPQEILGKISEEESISDKSSISTMQSKSRKNIRGTESFGSPLRKESVQTKRKIKASESSNSTKEEQVSATGSLTPSASTSRMEEYETSRRLTRHQRALLAKSIEMNSVIDCTHMNQSFQSSKDEEVGQASDDDDRMSHTSVRSSLRLQAKRQQEVLHGSPSSTASTIINPALTPSLKRRRRQSSSDVSDMNREASPASSVRRQRSLQPLGTPTNPGSLPGTPTRRSARLSALHGTSAQQSEDGESVTSLSPSSVASGRRSAPRRLSRHLSVSSESEQYAFAPPEVEHTITNENTAGDVSTTETYVFSPPKAIATPSKAKSTEPSGSTSKKSSRQSRASALHTIREESAAGRISQDDTVSDSPVTDSPVTRTTGRQSWFFVKPLSEEGQDKTPVNKNEDTQNKHESKRGWHSAYQQRKKFSGIPLPNYDDDSDESESEEPVKSRRTTRQSAPSRKQNH